MVDNTEGGGASLSKSLNRGKWHKNELVSPSKTDETLGDAVKVANNRRNLSGRNLGDSVGLSRFRQGKNVRKPTAG